MNAAFLGIKLVTDKIQGSTDTHDIETYEVLHDVQLALNTGVEILNDLLCFDKLEGGLLKLHKQNVPILRFVNETCGTVSGQARERGITLVVESTHSDDNPAFNDELEAIKTKYGILHPGEEVSLLHAADTCLFDRFKMEQVLRNLVR